MRRSSSRLQFGRGHLAAALVALDFEAQLLAFVQRHHAGAFHGRDVHEHIAAAVIRPDEAEALLRIEPLDDTGAGARSNATVAVPQ